MVTHQIPQHCLATVQHRKPSLALGLVVWTGRVGSQADIPASIITASVMHLLPGLFKKKKKKLDIFLWVRELMPGLLTMGPMGGSRTMSANMQPLCCSQCVVQWCSQTPKHVLLKLYDCTYRLLFYNHCKTSSRMSHEITVVDVNIYLVAIFAFSFFDWHVHLFTIYFGNWTLFPFFVC